MTRTSGEVRLAAPSPALTPRLSSSGHSEGGGSLQDSTEDSERNATIAGMPARWMSLYQIPHAIGLSRVTVAKIAARTRSDVSKLVQNSRFAPQLPSTKR
jgi:hypothetical protein